jgi:hypothetical protein
MVAGKFLKLLLGICEILLAVLFIGLGHVPVLHRLHRIHNVQQD